VRQADPGAEPGIQDQLVRRTAEDLAGIGDGHPTTGGCCSLLHPVILLTRRGRNA
jgi:hypothetical protein